ncbi:alpha-amylase family glycosyl hydrolase [Novosphingobium sp. 2580]|uniref:Alpha-amylase family glycosyl hydrolase n=2 Tax=Novosphingobium album (ex Hu et al. 2023) TaxID=2930093 RepID=A0ABT0AYH2_9SPHN|nr:alpha-amylase family glycosyl hydrolase [Novosphingobium album (ex Hu et al. 2023)]MCJ2177693.1 alpha-amylase family glycosyl hydrolase [Novosphingobium album (ex Hu et al. 2023)]
MRARTPDQEVIYFVLPDRFENGDTANDKGGLKGGKLQTGFDPSDKAFYHGGDLKGLTNKLDYVQGLGATAIWVGPVFKNKPVQGSPGQESAGYHGYWITDFTQVDPHLGTNAEFKALVDAAHARGMKVYMDIIANHTADVIRYKEGAAQGYPYRSKAAYPFSTRGGANGPAINAGFAGDDDPDPANWATLTDPSFAYTPVVPKGEEHVKVPGWLNDPIYYHNRGNTDWKGESAQYGDFVGLDDLATENPRVIDGMIAIYGDWIDKYGIDGFRIDTAKHVDPAFWRKFVPAMEARAKARGIPNFHIFGEVTDDDYDPALLASWTRNAGLPAVLDFSFMWAVVDAVSGKKGTEELARLDDDDALYQGGKAAALQLPTFLGNHDAGRIAMFIEKANPGIGAGELLARDELAHAMLLTLRGVPTIYYGDEQGFAGTGGDQLARQDMFPSKTALYDAETQVGTHATPAQDNFDTHHPLYTLIAQLSAVRRATPALTGGDTKLRGSSDKPGLFAVSRFDPKTGQEVLLAFNTSNQPLAASVEVEARSHAFTTLAGWACPAAATAPGSIAITLPPLGFTVCAANP